MATRNNNNNNNKNHVLKSIPPVPPVSFPREQKKLTYMERFALRAVNREFFFIQQYATDLNGGKPSTENERLIINEIIKKFEEFAILNVFWNQLKKPSLILLRTMIL